MQPQHMNDDELAQALHNGDLTELDLPTARRLAAALDRANEDDEDDEDE
ncbi:MAG: hypothetical protein ACOC93_05325 [Planctomycetota bacterium]